MKKIIFLLPFLFCLKLNAADIVQYDTSTANCLGYAEKEDEFKYMDDKGNPLPGYLIFTDKTQQTAEEVRKLLSSVSIIYFKKTGDPQITEMTQAEKDAVDGKNDSDRLIAIGDSYENRVDTDLLIIVLLERIAAIEGITPDKLIDEIKQAIADKLGLPSL